MPKSIDFTVEKGFSKIFLDLGGRRAVKSAVSQALKMEEVDSYELSLLICGDETIRELNKSYRKKDKATDVLSFPAPRILGDEVFYLGDLIISLPTVIKNAPKFNNTPDKELVRVTIHGILHLLGYDHEKVTPAIARKMRKRELEIGKLINAKR